MHKNLLSLAAACMFAAVTAHCALTEVPLQQRIAGSALVVEGMVTGKQSYWDVNHTMIYTAHTIEVFKVFKGSTTPAYIELLTQGGTVGDDRITVTPSLELQPGDAGVFTCETVSRIFPAIAARNAVPQFEPYASVQGFVKYDPVTNTAADPFTVYNGIETNLYPLLLQPGARYREVKSYDIPDPVRGNEPNNVNVAAINGFSPTTVTAGTGTTITITGIAFGAIRGIAVVRFKNADDGGATYITPLASQYVSWSNTQIVVEVPDNAGTGTIQVVRGTTYTSSGILTVSYAHQNVDFNTVLGMRAFQTDHVNDNGSGGYTLQMHTAFDADVLAKAAFSRALNSWRCNTHINWTMGAATTVNTAASDGTNVICYDNAAPLPAGVPATCYSYWTNCLSGLTRIWTVSEMDVVFDEGSGIAPSTWQYGPAAPSGSQYDFETVAVHELGHGHQLAHVIDPVSVMHFSVTAGTSNRTPGVNDLAGGNFVQAKSIVANLCGPGAMTNHTCAAPPVAAFSGAPTSICPGQSVTFTDQSTNSPTSRIWQFTGGTPATSTASNPVITYNTLGTYPVLLSVTSPAGSDVMQVAGYVTVNPVPVVTITANPANGQVCAGSPATLSGNGASSYTWTGGVTDGVPFTPLSTATYTVTGTLNGCQDTDTITLTVNTLPTVTATSNPAGNVLLCAGTPVTVTGSGASSYSWTGGVTDGVPFPSTTATTSYTVTGTDNNGCQDTASVSLSVIQCGPSSLPCGATYYNMLSQVSATLVPGAVSYRFTFYDNVTGLQVAQHTQASRTLVLGSVSGIYYNTTYRWTVAVDTGSGFSAESHPTCPVIFDVPHPVVPCGVSFQSLNSTIVASPTSRVTNFVFRFYDNVTGTLVAQRSQPSNILVFGLVSGLYNNMTYRYTVACEYPLSGGGTALGPESNNACTVTFGLPQTTLPCGTTYSVLNGVVTVPSCYGAANYHFRFYDNVTGLQVAQRIQPGNVLALNNVAGIYYANTYRWTVQVEYNVSTGGTAFGAESNSACTVTLSVPQTVVPCGGVYNYASGFANATAKFGATGYRFRFYQANVLVGQRTQVSRTLYFYQVPGLANNQAYTWTVEVEYNNGTGIVYGPPSTACPVTLGTPPTPSHQQESFTEAADETPAPLTLQVYPNPTHDKITIATSEPVEMIYLYSINGALLKTENRRNEMDLSGFNPGTYVIVVQTTSGVQRALVVKD